jgi:WD40 repeat protein
MNTRERAERVYLFLVVPTSKIRTRTTPRRRSAQNSMSSECRHSSCTSFVYRQSFPSLMSLPVDGGSSYTDRFHEWGIHGLRTFNFETILQAHDTAIRVLTLNHACTYIASADQSGIVKYFQPNMNNLTAWPAHREAVRGLSFSPDDERFATARDDSTVRIFRGESRGAHPYRPRMGRQVRRVAPNDGPARIGE